MRTIQASDSNSPRTKYDHAPRKTPWLPPILLLLVQVLFLLAPAQGSAQGQDHALPNQPSKPVQEEIKLGMTAGFSGPIREISVDLYHGAMACFQRINRQGGVHGRNISLVVLDDAYTPGPAMANVVHLVEEDRVLCLFNCVGSPTLTRVLPLLTHYSQEHVLLLFPFSGAEPLYASIHSGSIYLFRPSYDRELRDVIDRLLQAGRTRISVLYQADAFGRSGWQSVKTALKERGLAMVSDGAYARGATFESSFLSQVETVLAGKPDAVVNVATAGSASGFIRDLRRSGSCLPVVSISSVNAQEQYRILSTLSARDDRDYLVGLVNSQTVPFFNDPDLAAAIEYRAAMAEETVGPPPFLATQDYTPHDMSPTGFEGFLAAKLMATILEKLGPEVSRATLTSRIADLGPLDIGLARPVHFTTMNRIALHDIHYIAFDADGLIPIDDWNLGHCP
ncbi:MAG: ABC transporter substrate-binding protein [Deltaproteobacteria bacterium]|nr:ABC transporter substrate-binding protein [Deltaproteobacteria bacterium]